MGFSCRTSALVSPQQNSGGDTTVTVLLSFYNSLKFLGLLFCLFEINVVCPTFLFFVEINVMCPHFGETW